MSDDDDLPLGMGSDIEDDDEDCESVVERNSEGCENRGRKGTADAISVARMKTKADVSNEMSVYDVILFNQLEGARQRAQLLTFVQQLGDNLRKQGQDGVADVRFDDDSLGRAAVKACKEYLNKKVKAGGFAAARTVQKEEQRKNIVLRVCASEGVDPKSCMAVHANAKKVVY